MSIQAITTKVISTLGNKESLVPIMVKDGVDSGCLTYRSYKEGGKVEGIDRAIDEFGTQLIWIGGIPFCKYFYDKTIYQKSKINPGVDPRIIANNEYASWAKENAKGIMSNSKTQTVKEAVTDCLKDGGKKAQNLYKGKIITATALTLAAFFLLTKVKQKNTKNSVIKDMDSKVSDTFENKQETKNNVNVFSDFNLNNKEAKEVFSDIDSYSKQEKNKPAFKGGIIKNVTDAVMFNPVHNMKIIDAGITTERLACSRNKTEFGEHAIKEGGFLFFLYCFGGLLEKGINKLSSKVLNKPIDLDIDVIMDSKFEDALSKGKIASDISKLPKDGSLTDKLNFIVNNPENSVVQAAKKSKIVSTVKDKTGEKVVDTSKYIDTKAFDKLAENMQVIDEKFKSSKEPVKKFLNKTKALKVGSVMANIGVSCLFLGYILPKAVYKFREKETGTTKFHVAENIKNESKNHNSK